MLTARCVRSTAVFCGHATAISAQPTQRQAWQPGRSNLALSITYQPCAQLQRGAGQRLLLACAAADGSTSQQGPPAADTAQEELPLWRFLRQQGFSIDFVSGMQAAVGNGTVHAIRTGRRFTEQKLQRDLAPNIAALRAEGLGTATIEQLFHFFPTLLTTTHTTFSSSLVALRQLAALLPDDPRTVQAPPGATRLGVALWRYPSTATRLLSQARLASVIDGNLRLRRQLGISDAATAAAMFRYGSAVVSNFERAEAMVAHLQCLQASGELSADQVARVALSEALRLTPDEFDRRRREGGTINSLSLRDPAGRQLAAAQGLGELLQAADGVPGPLQQKYLQQGETLVRRQPRLWITRPATLHTSWASLQQLGLSSSQVAAVVQLQPAVLAYSWEGETKQRLLAWVQQELGLSPYDFFTRHAGYATGSVATIAMRADYLRQHRPAVWESKLARGTGPLLSLLSESRFYERAGCTEAEVADFNRTWLTIPAGQRWGSKATQVHRRTDKAA